MNESNTNFRLTKVGVVILIFTLISSVLFFVLGIVSLTSADNEGKITSNNTYLVYENTSKSFSATSAKTYTIKFKPDHSGSFVLKIDGAYITGITRDGGSSVSYTSSSGVYDYTYKTNLNSSYTYIITIKATSNSIRFLAEH